jgi:hypothetical protein
MLWRRHDPPRNFPEPPVYLDDGAEQHLAEEQQHWREERKALEQALRRLPAAG